MPRVPSQFYFLAAFFDLTLAQRFFCAAAILALASGLILRLAVLAPLGRPLFLVTPAAAVPELPDSAWSICCRRV